MMFKTVLSLGFLAPTWAACANMCSGHGYCTNYAPQFSVYPNPKIQVPSVSHITGDAESMDVKGYDTRDQKKDTCTCFTKPGMNGNTVYQYTGADCSLHTCPHGISWNGQAMAANQLGTTRGTSYHTQHLECSGQGLCNRKSAICECFEGYTGEACQRSACPNDCSGAGVCMDLAQIVENVRENAGYYGDYLDSISYSAWDAKQLRGCVCDKGRSGPDCSMIDCPSTSDIMKGDGSERGLVCSGRGKCDWSIGECKCFDGYHGSSCNAQRNQAV